MLNGRKLFFSYFSFVFVFFAFSAADLVDLLQKKNQIPPESLIVGNMLELRLNQGSRPLFF